ncbi:MAG: hypothetical protein ACREJO_05430 [Phycisphaerales bacterium]
MDASTHHLLQAELFRAISALNAIAELSGAPARERRLAATAALEACSAELARVQSAGEADVSTALSDNLGSRGGLGSPSASSTKDRTQAHIDSACRPPSAVLAGAAAQAPAAAASGSPASAPRPQHHNAEIPRAA